MTFSAGGFAYKIVLPHLSGFSDFCVRLFGADLGSFQLQVGGRGWVGGGGGGGGRRVREGGLVGCLRLVAV